MRVERWTEKRKPDVAELKQRLQNEGYSAFEWTDPPGTRYGPHSHPEDQSHWIVAGELELVIDGASYTLQAGDRDFLPAHTTHSAFVPGSERVRYLIGAKYC